MKSANPFLLKRELISQINKLPRAKKEKLASVIFTSISYLNSGYDDIKLKGVKYNEGE